MPKNKDFALRIETIDECLRNNYRIWTLETLLKSVNEKLMDRYGKKASKRTIQDDLKFLKEEKDAPIRKRKEGSQTVFYYDRPDFSIKNLPIRQEEIGFLKDALHILRQVNDFKLLDDIEEIVGKLQNTIDATTVQSDPIIQFEKNSLTKGSGFIDDFYNAIKEKTALRVTYKSFKNDGSRTFVFHSYLIKEYRNRWFVIGRKDKSNVISNLALDRVEEVKNSSFDYIANDLIDVSTYFCNVIGVTVPQDRKVEKVQMKIKSSQVPYILTKPIHHSQRVLEKHDSGDIILELNVVYNFELGAVLLSFGCELEVIKPQWLRKEITDVLKAAVGNYE